MKIQPRKTCRFFPKHKAKALAEKGDYFILNVLNFHLRKARSEDLKRINKIVDSLSSDDRRSFHPIDFGSSSSPTSRLRHLVFTLNTKVRIHSFFLKIWPRLARISLVAVADGNDSEILGFAYLSTIKRASADTYSGELGIVVTERARGLGVSNALMVELIEQGKREKIRKIWLSVLSDNSRAIKLYSRFGFKQTQTKKDYWNGANNDSIVMALQD